MRARRPERRHFAARGTIARAPRRRSRRSWTRAADPGPGPGPKPSRGRTSRTRSDGSSRCVAASVSSSSPSPIVRSFLDRPPSLPADALASASPPTPLPQLAGPNAETYWSTLSAFLQKQIAKTELDARVPALLQGSRDAVRLHDAFLRGIYSTAVSKSRALARQQAAAMAQQQQQQQQQGGGGGGGGGRRGRRNRNRNRNRARIQQ